MPQTPLIGITGRARSGKDTVANFVIAAVGGYRYSFADPIRAMLMPLGIDMSDPYWQARKEDVIPVLGVSPRRMMQTLGTEWGRNLISPDLWVVLAHQCLLRNGPGMVIPDVRFENEAAWVRKHGGRIIHVVRPNVAPVEAHASEDGIEVLPEDAQLSNSGTLEELQLSVRELLRVYD
jgi:hypothetical protein